MTGHPAQSDPSYLPLSEVGECVKGEIVVGIEDTHCMALGEVLQEDGRCFRDERA